MIRLDQAAPRLIVMSFERTSIHACGQAVLNWSIFILAEIASVKLGNFSLFSALHFELSLVISAE
jgi:hypothetical protein